MQLSEREAQRTQPYKGKYVPYVGKQSKGIQQGEPVVQARPKRQALGGSA